MSVPMTSGHVVDRDGTPVPHAHVVVAAGPEPFPEVGLVADAAGRFAVALAPGRWTLRAHAGAGTGEAHVELAGGGGDVVIAIEAGAIEGAGT